MKNTKTKSNAGRPIGSYSFVRIPLSELTAKIADPSTNVIVSRKFAEVLGIKTTSVPANQTAQTIEAATAPAVVAQEL